MLYDKKPGQPSGQHNFADVAQAIDRSLQEREQTLQRSIDKALPLHGPTTASYLCLKV